MFNTGDEPELLNLLSHLKKVKEVKEKLLAKGSIPREDTPLTNLNVLDSIKTVDAAVTSAVSTGNAKALSQCMYSTDTAIFNLQGIWNNDNS